MPRPLAERSEPIAQPLLACSKSGKLTCAARAVSFFGGVAVAIMSAKLTLVTTMLWSYATKSSAVIG